MEPRPQTTTFEVRRATVADAAAVARTHVASWQVGYAGLLPDELLSGLSVEARTSTWTNQLDGTSPAAATLVAALHGAVVGFASVGPSRDPDATAATGELWALYSHPESWGLGVGSALLAAASDELRRLGLARHATLWVLTGNDRARRFYERHGWRPDGEHRVEWRGEVPLDEVRYAKADLGPLPG